jgi:hypothetical protein
LILADNGTNQTGGYNLQVGVEVNNEAKDVFEGGYYGNNVSWAASQVNLDVNGQASVDGLTVHKGIDVDWFKFTVPYGTDGTAQLELENVVHGLQGQMSLYENYWSSQPTLTQSGSGPDAEVTLNATGLRGGTTYYLKVNGLGSTTGIYDLGITVGMLCADGCEGNDAWNTATALTLSDLGTCSMAELSIHRSNDVDWYSLTTPATTDGSLVVTTSGLTGGLSGSVTASFRAPEVSCSVT